MTPSTNAVMPPMRKRERTRQAFIETMIELIAREGTDDISVLALTQELSVSNGSFYYHFADREELLDAVGERVVGDLTRTIAGIDRSDPAAKVAFGSLKVLFYADEFPDLVHVMLRWITRTFEKDVDRNYLLDDISRGIESGHFSAPDARLASLLCRSLIAEALRLKLSTEVIADLNAKSVTHLLAMLGVDQEDAAKIVGRETADAKSAARVSSSTV